jgi:hypothetical protein
MSKRGIPAQIFKLYPQSRLDSLFTARENFGKSFLYLFLLLKGSHLFIIGNTRSGKTIKKQGILWWLCKLETIIEFDTGKPGDIEAFFDSPEEDTKFNKPIQVLIPYGCEFRIEGVPEGQIVEIVPVMTPEGYFDLIKPGWINIISLRNYFLDESNLKKYLVKMFNRFDQRARLGDFARFCPCTISIDEAHAMIGTQGVDNSAESIILTQYLSRWQREMAASQIRTLITTQRFKDVPPAVRDNAPNFIACRGMNVDKSDNATLHYLSGFAKSCLPSQGWFILNDLYFYHGCPMPFRHYKIPANIKIIYQDRQNPIFVDGIQDPETHELLQDQRQLCDSLTCVIEESLSRKEDLMEDLPDLGIYGSLLSKRKGVKNEN